MTVFCVAGVSVAISQCQSKGLDDEEPKADPRAISRAYITQIMEALGSEEEGHLLLPHRLSHFSSWLHNISGTDCPGGRPYVDFSRVIVFGLISFP